MRQGLLPPSHPAPTVALSDGTYEPAAGPVKHRLPLRNGGELRRGRAAKLAQGRFVLTRRLTVARAPG